MKHVEDFNLFIDDVLKVYEKHSLSIAHEDEHGSFIVEKFSQTNVEWLQVARNDVDGKAAERIRQDIERFTE